MEPASVPADRDDRPRRDPPALALAREFSADPLGAHGPALNAVLSLLRGGDVTGKYCLIAIRPHAEWVIGRLSGRRGAPPTVEDNRVFHRIEDAEWAVFKLRWAQTFGEAIDEDAL